MGGDSNIKVTKRLINSGSIKRRSSYRNKLVQYNVSPFDNVSKTGAIDLLDIVDISQGNYGLFKRNATGKLSLIHI